MAMPLPQPPKCLKKLAIYDQKQDCRGVGGQIWTICDDATQSRQRGNSSRADQLFSAFSLAPLRLSERRTNRGLPVQHTVGLCGPI